MLPNCQSVPQQDSVASASSTSATNFRNLIEPRVAPGARGPTPTACGECRRLRTKCDRPNGGENACLVCTRKGIPCRAPSIVTKNRRVNSQAEQAIVKTQLSTARATNLFELYLDPSPSKPGFEHAILLLIYHDLYSLQARFAAVGKKLENLEAHEQLRCRLVWAASGKRWLSDTSSARQILHEAEQAADEAAIWRKPTVPNLVSLLLLYLISSYGELLHVEAFHYLQASITIFRQLFTTPYSLLNPSTQRPEWSSYQCAVAGVLAALEGGTEPTFSDREISVFTHNVPSYFLPSPSGLLQMLASQPFEIVDNLIYAKTFYLLLSRDLARYFSRPRQSVPISDDLGLLRWAWEKLDILHEWEIECLSSFQSTKVTANSAYRITTRTAIAFNWIPFITLEFSILDYLDAKFRLLSESLNSSYTSDTLADMGCVSSLVSIARARRERALCAYLRLSRNRNGLYQLGAAAGFYFSVERLNELTLALVESDVENPAVHPIGALDKLASVAFFLKTLRNAHLIFRHSNLESSIGLLSRLQGDLETESGYSADLALSLMTSLSPYTTIDSSLPATPPSELVKAAASIYHLPLQTRDRELN